MSQYLDKRQVDVETNLVSYDFANGVNQKLNIDSKLLKNYVLVVFTPYGPFINKNWTNYNNKPKYKKTKCSSVLSSIPKFLK